ncbi:MAG: hypothetical protein NTV54_00135 [Ignavibacteriales bacterium]|nr:hypothetical protein [Ignavibacteriales bacterium]
MTIDYYAARQNRLAGINANAMEYEMTIKQKEDKFFASFPIPSKIVVRDGIVEEGSYSISNPKLLFLLKEPESPGEGGWSLADHIHTEKRTPIFDTIARWVSGIRNLPANLPWWAVKDISPYTRICVLNFVVLFNLKKTPGYGTADEIALERFVEKNVDLLKEQFSFYNPDVVVCCGNSTTRLFDKFLSPINKPWSKTRAGIPYREYEPKRIAIAYTHPQARVNKEKQYDGIVNAVREILIK